MQRFFDGFDLIPPGVEWISEWRPDPGVRSFARLRSLHAGAGRKAQLGVPCAREAGVYFAAAAVRASMPSWLGDPHLPPGPADPPAR